MVKLVFLDPHSRELYADWPRKARDAAADLRRIAVRHPDDRELAELIGELAVKSPEFPALWAGHHIHGCFTKSTRDFRHPLVGALTLHNEVMDLYEAGGQRLAVLTAPQGSPSAAALALLAQLTPERAGAGAGGPVVPEAKGTGPPPDPAEAPGTPALGSPTSGTSASGPPASGPRPR